MRSHFQAAFVALALGVVPTHGQSRPAENLRLDRLTQWMAIVAQHRPGQIDAAVNTIRSSERESLQHVRDDLYAIRQLICAARVSSTGDNNGSKCTPPPVNTPGTQQLATNAASRTGGAMPSRQWAGTYTPSHLRDLSVVAADIDRRGDINDILKRGALLHTDVALLAPPAITWAPVATVRFLQRTVVHVGDGQQSGVDQSVDHLEMARRLLDIVTPDPRRDLETHPERDTMVRDWYRATAAVLLSRQHLYVNHTKASLEIFPDHDGVLLMAGALHEALATPLFQRGVATRSVGAVSFIESQETELRLAERFLRQALQINPRHAEARLRLGQVLGRRERHAEALVELRAASEVLREPLMQYYAAMFIGRAEAALDNIERARAAYQRAATLYPRAQSPHIGLSELEMRSGNRAAAAQALDVVWGWRRLPQQDDDPWWYYPYAAGRHGAEQLNTIGAAFPPSTGAR